ncbi:MAG: hypothetical protein ACRCWR_04820, partial [Saezia sp.]
KHRSLDCLVINTALKIAESEKEAFDAVRGAFLEGTEAYPNAGFRANSHIQISVINPNCIKGIFLPRSKK